MIQRDDKQEYKFLKFSTHDQAEKALNQYTSDGWQFVSYQAAGDSSAVTHFLLLSRPASGADPRRFGF